MRYSEKLKKVLKQFLEKLGVVQTHVVLNVLYVLVGAPVSAVMKILSHDPTMPEADDGSYWQERNEMAHTLDEFMRQY